MRLRWASFRPETSLIAYMLRLGLPASIEQSTRALGLLAMTFLVASFGTVTVAAYGIGIRILSFVIIPSLGLSMATSTLVGQNIGARRLMRARAIARLSALVAMVSLTTAGIGIFIFARPLVAAFVPDAHATINEGALFVHMTALTFGLIGVQQALSGAFRGAGNTQAAMLIALLSLWVFRLPLAWLLSHYTDLAQTGLWLAFPFATLISALAAIVWFSRGGVSYKHYHPASAPS
jgi:Na+-driven multidrug efflux pump